MVIDTTTYLYPDIFWNVVCFQCQEPGQCLEQHVLSLQVVVLLFKTEFVNVIYVNFGIEIGEF